jgi:hypothetical protein
MDRSFTIHLGEMGAAAQRVSVATRSMAAMTRTLTHDLGRLRDPESVAGEGDRDDEWTAAPPDLAVRVLAVVADTLQDYDDIDWAGRPPQVQLAMLRSLERLWSVLDVVQLRVVAGAERSGAARSDGWATTKDLVTAVTGGPRSSGRRTVALAQSLTTDPTETARRLGAGWISRVQAEVVVAAVERLPGRPGLRDAAEMLLLDQAATRDATELAELGRHVQERLDPDGTDARDEQALEREERAAHHGRFLSVTEDGIGGVRVKGRGTVEDAAWLKGVLLPMAAPQTTEPGTCGGDPARPAHGCGVADCAHDGRDPRDHGVRMWDALVEACRRLAGTDVPPSSHGSRPRVVVTVDHDALRQRVVGDGSGSAGLGDLGSRLSAGAVRRLACDAEVLPVVLGGRSEVLDVGRARRLVTPPIWQALVIRDRHCAFPGCARPPVACDAHHLRHWADGGATALDNLVLLCRARHMTVHTTPWQVRLRRDDRRPEFVAPPGRYRDPLPIRHRPLRT